MMICQTKTKIVLFSNSGAFIDSTNSSSSSRNPPEPLMDPAHYLTISLLTSQILLDHILSLDDPYDMSEKWLDQFTEILDQIAPFKLRKVKNTSVPFIDKHLRRECKMGALGQIHHNGHFLNHFANESSKGTIK